VKYHRKLLLFLCIALAAATILGPWIAALWTAVFASRPQFARIFGGVFGASASALLLSDRSLLRLQFLRDIGLAPFRERWPDLLRGFVMAAASVAVLSLLMAAAGVFTPGFFHPLQDSVRWVVKALLTALLVGFFEELFFRGVVFKGLLEEARPATAFAAANLFYAAVHFFKPPEKFAVAGLDPLAGLRYVGECLQLYRDPVEILPGVIGLFIIGLVLSYALWRTGALYLSIGLHAGWVFALKIMRVFGEFERADLGLLFGSTDPKVVSGVATWIGIALVGVVVHFITQKREHKTGFPLSRE
jgi:membrane protease YdiL (CAAX protease family)